VRVGVVLDKGRQLLAVGEHRVKVSRDGRHVSLSSSDVTIIPGIGAAVQGYYVKVL
jgi:hypothetical protein